MDSNQTDIEILRSQLRCPCDFCRFPEEIQGEICRTLDYVRFLKLRCLSCCWNARYLLFGPGQGLLSWGQLSCGLREKRHYDTCVPEINRLFGCLRPKQIGSCQDSVIMLTPQGEIWASFGISEGQLAVPPGADHVIQIACGHSHVLARTRTGQLLAFGSNGAGQLGDGTTTFRAHFVPVLGPLSGRPIVDMAAGYHYSLALTDTGEVFAWGDNTSGQVGNGTTAPTDLPVQVVGLDGQRVTRVRTGGLHSLALTEQGEVYVWGANNHGLLGDGTDEPRRIPQRVQLPRGVRIADIAGSFFHTIVVSRQGALYAWGKNRFGAVGNNSSVDCHAPVRLPWPNGQRVVQLATGAGHTLALTSQGELWAWGNNQDGQLASPITKRSCRLPTRVESPLLPRHPAILGRLHVAAGWFCSFVWWE